MRITHSLMTTFDQGYCLRACCQVVCTDAEALPREEARHLRLVHAAADGGDAGAEVDVPRGEAGVLQDAVRHLPAREPSSATKAQAWQSWE